jgi:hypothetical protein
MLQNKNKIQVITLSEWHAPGGSAAVGYWLYFRFRRMARFGRNHFVMVGCLAMLLGFGVNSVLAYHLIYKHDIQLSGSLGRAIEKVTGNNPLAQGNSTDNSSGHSSGKAAGGTTSSGKSATGSSSASTGGTASSGSTDGTSSSGGGASSGGESSGGVTCAISSILVNSCRPWLGAAANWYTTGGTGFGNWKAEILAHESRIGRQVDVAHDYSGPGDSLTSDEKYFINRPNTYLMLNYKPVSGGTSGHQWADGTGCGSAACNAIDNNIDIMANSIKSMGSKKVFLSLWTEPDDDISPGGSPGCVAAGSATTGKMGTTADYVNMWHNVRARFNSAGATNVVWVWTVQGYVGHNCDVNDLWPGNSYVDWVAWDPYLGSNKTLDQLGVGLFYNFLTSNSTGAHSYSSKPWALNEWGAEVVGSPASTYALYGRMKTALDSGTYPNLKMFNVWDSHVASSTKNWQIGFAQLNSSNPPSLSADPSEQAAYNAFANDPRFTDAFY